jgi:ADP-heptose:LPS heptosyltransferase
MKKCLIIRLGAIGDMIIITPVLPLLKKDGYHITVNTKAKGKKILEHSPYIEEWLIHPDDATADMEWLKEHWSKISEGYDKVINFTGTIENRLSKAKKLIGDKSDREKRFNDCNVNFYDYTLEHAGYPEIKGRKGELYFCKSERKFGRNIRQKYKDKFLIIWVMNGSAWHKVYPYAELVAQDFMHKYGHRTQIITVGDQLSRFLEFDLPNVLRTSGNWSVRRTLSVLEHADLVIGTDTGIMHGAGCYDVPKILLLSANTEENLSKYWKNTINITPDDVYCHPCHRLTFQAEECPSEEDYAGVSPIGVRLPICMTRIKQEKVYNAIEKVYKDWE